MVLSSQMGRSGMGRRYMTSRRRNRSIWRWAIPLLVVAIIMTFWLWPGGSSNQTPQTQQRTSDPINTSTATFPPPKNNGTNDAMGSKTQSIPSPNRSKRSVDPILRPNTAQAAAPIASPANNRVQPVSDPTEVMAALPYANNEVSVETSGRLAIGLNLIETGAFVEARSILNSLLADINTHTNQANAIRQYLAQINETLVFSSRIIPDDPLVEAYTIKSGDLLSTIAPIYRIPYQFIELINGISARRIRVGQTIKVIKGPVHVIVHKSQYRMDLFLNGPEDEPVYIRSFSVGVGQDNSTPEGSWIVRRAGKLANPGWTNPRTGQVYSPNDPQNPIGEYWIGLKGSDEKTRGLAGYGIHGTIEPNTIGKQVSMGCVRLQPQDIAMVYTMLTNAHSTVTVKQ